MPRQTMGGAGVYLASRASVCRKLSVVTPTTSISRPLPLESSARTAHRGFAVRSGFYTGVKARIRLKIEMLKTIFERLSKDSSTLPAYRNCKYPNSRYANIVHGYNDSSDTNITAAATVAKNSRQTARRGWRPARPPRRPRAAAARPRRGGRSPAGAGVGRTDVPGRSGNNLWYILFKLLRRRFVHPRTRPRGKHVKKPPSTRIQVSGRHSRSSFGGRIYGIFWHCAPTEGYVTITIAVTAAEEQNDASSSRYT
ncbi:hypothetical protein EVAR_102706_1 [Eumeta japonica]|uniref:Uncharacterized protein n=1 Tax=Eumeta variegata TaxID=151549 RepID=A0A4C1TKW2_EUMVA|nr:hypothetical protein EVAR_102706_1 [Eumeta japonica]